MVIRYRTMAEAVADAFLTLARRHHALAAEAEVLRSQLAEKSAAPTSGDGPLL